MDIGSPLGDGLSPILFIVYLESCLREVERRFPPRPEENKNLVPNSQYADDCNWYSRQRKLLEDSLATIADVFCEYVFKVNVSKTEWTKVHLDEDKSKRGKEDWRKVRQLGNLLGDLEDVNRRKQLASVAFGSLYSLCISVQRTIIFVFAVHLCIRRVRLYNAYVLPVLTYNCSIWCLTDAEMGKLSSFHRRQLRSLLGIGWPMNISNKALYEKLDTFSSRLRLFGHVLRLPERTPAQQTVSLHYSGGKRSRGRPRFTLINRLKKGLTGVGIRMKTDKDLANLRRIAIEIITELETNQEVGAHH